MAGLAPFCSTDGGLPLTASRSSLTWPAAFAIVALRFVVGAHFFHEGYTKWRDPKPFSAPVFSAAKGPLAGLYHDRVWDRDGISRLDRDSTYEIWGVSFPKGEKKDPEFTGSGYLGKAIQHFGFTQEQADEAAAVVMARVRQYQEALEQWEGDIAEYQYGLERRQNYANDPARSLASLGKHDARINTELTSKRMPWQTEIDKIWTGLEKDINDLADRADVANRGYLELSERPGEQVLGTRWMDRYIPYFDMTIGVLLVVGLFTRVAASVGAAFLASIVLSQWPFAPDAMATGYQQVEMCSMLVLATIGAGKYAGLDALLGNCCSWCCRAAKTNGNAEASTSLKR